ncbi:LysR family transcriptional regulator [Bosea sp. Tri-44]|uniref:LysR family transcriptional regulator n=1 Tax=Bosea sp. Tri-44 TaxID=1972137 RepID=UPI00100DDE95|nr:LysR family transcriptional regulator [Bosea sp. Tri-44]RXT53177.1 LysR family transcriptional regulator [Bosea sp. Tri-44]
MNLDVGQLRAFVTIAHSGSFTRAAASLNLSQPALTVQIRKLEEALGVRLFDRNTRVVALTRNGAELLPTLGRILRDLDGVLAETRQLSTMQRGIVRLAVLPSFASGMLPEIIADFRTSHPGVGFVVRDVIASGVAELVASGEADLGLTGGAVSNADLEILLHGSDRMHAVYPKDHPLARLAKIGIADLARHPLVLMDAATSVRQVVDRAFAETGTVPLVGAEVTYMSSAVGMVRAGLGVAILPGAAMEVRAERSLRSQPIEGDGFVRPIAVVKRRGRTLPPASERFLAELKRMLAAER